MLAAMSEGDESGEMAREAASRGPSGSRGAGEPERRQASGGPGRSGVDGPTLPRVSLALVATVHALIFAWAGAKLPWSDWSTFAVVCLVLAVAHAVTAVAALVRLPALAAIWRVASVLGLVTLGWLVWELASSASYLAGLYGDFGKGIAAAMLSLLGLVALLTLPLSAWGLAVTWRGRWTRRAAAGTAVALAFVGLGSGQAFASARGDALAVPGGDQRTIHDELHDALEARISSWEQTMPAVPRRGRKGRPSLYTLDPVACAPPARDDGQARAVLTYLQARDEGVVPVTRCLVAAPEALAAAVAEHIAAEALRAPVKIDVLRRVAPLHSRGPLRDMLAVRPGLDGVCDDVDCLMPWQLVASGQFIANEPMPWIPDFRFGISPVRLHHALDFDVSEDARRWDRRLRRPGKAKPAEPAADGAEPSPPDDYELWSRLDGLRRIETASFVITARGRLIQLARGREADLELTRVRLDAAGDRAEGFIDRAQLSSGRFRYTLDPYTGRQNRRSWNLPRQAGTTLVMCELGRDKARVSRVGGRSLAYMAEHARWAPGGELAALIRKRDRNDAMLGATALPAIAFLSCRPRVGDAHDRLIAAMTRLLLAMQRDDGSFYPIYVVSETRPVDGPEPMYAGGQAIFALSLAEKLARDQPDAAAAAGLPPREQLQAAVERAMNYYAGPYWDTFTRDFFFLEENWHCLAARASLDHHRNADYEQYCLDYMAYKARLVLDEDSRVAPEFIGGFSLGNILPPVNTPAAGFGEGLAAAMAIKQARGEDLSDDREQMHAVLTFLLRQQWNREVCFACSPRRNPVGGLSESMSAAEIRIDYTQHGWAAIGHGGAFLRERLAVGQEDDEG